LSAALEVRLSPEQLDELAERIAERLREPEEDHWLTTREAAEYLRIHPVTLRRLAAERRVPFIQECPGCALHFRRSDLDARRRGVDSGGTLSTRRKRPGGADTPRGRTRRDDLHAT
jgi:excisionase family DNA binding protein